MPRKKIRTIETDLDLTEKRNQHTRTERLKNMVHWCILGGIVVFSVIIGILALSLVGHWVYTKNWDAVMHALHVIMGAIGGYLVSYFKLHEIIK